MYFESKECMLFVLSRDINIPLILSQSLSCIGRTCRWGLLFLIKLGIFVFYYLVQHTKKKLHQEENVLKLTS